MLKLDPHQYNVSVEFDCLGWELAAKVDPRIDGALFRLLAEFPIRKGFRIFRLVEFLGTVGDPNCKRTSLSDIGLIGRRHNLEPATPSDLLAFYLYNPEAPEVGLSDPYKVGDNQYYFGTGNREAPCSGSCSRGCRRACFGKDWFRSWRGATGARPFGICCIGTSPVVGDRYLFREIIDKNHPIKFLE